MTLHYDVPKHLESYLEYIPQDMISEFITKAIENAIENRNLEEQPAEPEKPPVDYSELLSKITEMFATAKIPENLAPAKQEDTFVPPTYSFEVVSSNDAEASPEDDSLINDFLSDICK